jgi:cation-transporting ATPase E
VVQEVRSKRAVERLSVLHMPRAKVVRDSQETEIPSERIVLDDVLLLSMGSPDTTDAVVLTGAVEVDESPFDRRGRRTDQASG